MYARVTGDHEQIPAEFHGVGVTVGFLPAQDLPVLVLRPRVGAAHRLAVFAALGVVGQGAIHLAVLGADHDPFRRSMRVALTRLAARRAWISTSAWLGNPVAASMPFLPWVSSIHCPLPLGWSGLPSPSSKRATYKVPWSSRLRLAVGLLWMILSWLTNL